MVVSPNDALLAAFLNLTLAFKILPNDGVTVSVLTVVEVGLAKDLAPTGSSSLLLQPTNNKAATRGVKTNCL